MEQAHFVFKNARLKIRQLDKEVMLWHVPFAKKFYNSKTWKLCRQSFIADRVSIDGGMCQQCKERLGYIVDHKKEITPDNINNPDVTLSNENFQYLCLDCHNRKTFGKNLATIREGLMFNSDGNIIENKNTFIVWGAPASGKTSYVKENKGQHDIVVDLDYIRSALSLGEDSKDTIAFALDIRELIYDLIEQRVHHYDRAWIICMLPTRSQRSELSRRLKAELIHIDTDKEECIRRSTRDNTREDKELQQYIINKYFDEVEL